MDEDLMMPVSVQGDEDSPDLDYYAHPTGDYTDMARAALNLAKLRNSDKGEAVLRKARETGMPPAFWQQADNSMLATQKGDTSQLSDSGKRYLVENPQGADVFKNDLQAVNRIVWGSETGEEKRAVLNANLPANWQSMVSAARKQGIFDEIKSETFEDINRLPAEELASIAMRKALSAHLEAKGRYPHLVQLGQMLIWGEASSKILTPTDSSVFARYYASRGFTPLQMEYCQSVLNWQPLDAKTLPNGRTKVTQWAAMNTVFMQGRGNDPVIYKTAEYIPAAAVPLWLRKSEERQRRADLMREHAKDFDDVKTMRQLRTGTNGAEYVRQLMVEVRTMAVLTQRYGDKWHDFSDEALEEAFKSVEEQTGVPAVMLSVKRFRPADAGSFDKIEKLWDFFTAGSLAERVVRAHGDELLEIYKNFENASYADNLALVENSGLEELHRQMRGKTWGYQLLNMGVDLVPLVVESLVTMSPAPALARGMSAKTFLRKAAEFIGKRTLTELPTVMVNTANAVEDHRIDWLTGEIGDRKDVMETFSQQFLNTSAEILSEVMGGAVSGLVGKGMRAGLTKVLPESVKQSLMANTIAGAYKTASQKAFVKAAKKVAEAGGWTDALSEYLEEKGGDALRFALTRIGEATGTQHLNLGQESIFGSVQEEAELFTLVATLGVGFGTIPAIATGVDVARAMAYSNRQLELNKRIRESEAAKSSPEATALLLRQYTRFQEEPAYISTEDAMALIEAEPELAEKLGLNTELVEFAAERGLSFPLDMIAAQTQLDTAQLRTLLDSVIPPSGGGMTIKEIRDLSLEQSDLDRAQTIDIERKAVRAAIEEKVSQLESLGRPAKEIRAFTRLMSFADYLARHSNTSVSQWIKNLKIQQMKEADFLRMLEEVPEGVRYQGGSRKGAISFGEAFEATVTVFEGKGDLSTLCHETGHYILEMMRRLVASGLGDAQMESDLQTLEKWMARDTADPEAQDEKLACGFELYLREGESPSPKLDGAFATFREILRRIYHTVKMLNVEINDEVRNVFDRILSSDQTVSDNAFLREVAQKLDLGLLGLNDEERKSFIGLMAQANQQAITQMEKEKASQLKVLKTQWRKDAKNAMAEMPEYVVWDKIKKFGRMDYDSIKELVGEDIANKLHERGLAVKKRTNQRGELNIVFPANYLPADGSFGSLQEMLQTLADTEPPADFTARYLAEREVEFNADFEMSEAALTTQASVDSYDRLIELLAVKGGREGYRIRRQEMKVKAQETIEQLSVGGILSKKLDNDCRAGLRKVVAAANKKDYATAFEEARKLRANLEVLRLRGAAKERISRFGQLKRKVRDAKLGKIEGTHQDALTALFVLLGQYRPKTVEKRWGEALESILESLKKEYEGIADLESLLTSAPLKQRSFGEFQQLAQFAEYIYEAGRAEVSDGKMAFKRQVSEDVNSALEAMGDIPPGKAKRNETGVSAKALNYAFDSNEQLRNIWGKMCGNNVESPAYAPYKRLMVAASEQLRLQQPLLRRVGDALKALTKSGKKWDMEGLPTIPEAIVNAGNYTKWTPDMVLAVCLNLGCAKNRQRLQDVYGFTDADLENIAGRLSKADWDSVQAVWDAINAPELVSAAQKAYRDEFFADMPLEEAFGFEVRSSDAQDLQIKGGYYPLAYLPDIGTPDGSVNTESADTSPLRRPGFTYSRQQKTMRAIRLSPTVAIGHINDVAHYATHREAVRLMARIIGDSRFRNKFQESQGFNRYRVLVKRVQAVANPKEFIQSMGDMERYLRSVLTTSALWGNLSTAGMQFASAFVGVDEVKGYYLPSLMATWGHTLKDYVSGNAEGRMDTPYARAVTLSGLMRDRMNLRDYDLGALRGRMDKGLFSAILKPVNMAGFMLSNAMDTMITVPIWDAAYRKAVDEGKSLEEAVAVADELVAKTQGAYRPLDQTSAQTDPGFVRYATAFMSPAVAQYNTTLRAFRKLKTQGLKESWMAIACSVASPLLMGALIRWAYAGDDEDKAERAALRETIGFWVQGVPVVRDIVDVVINSATGGWQGGSAVSTTVGEGVDALQKPLVAAGKAVEKQDFDRAVWKLAEAVSIALKAPVIPAYRRLRKTFMDHGADKYFLPPVPGDKR